MQRIAKMLEQMKDEAQGAVEYAECAENAKAYDASLCSAYTNMARTELSHYDELSALIGRELQKHTETERGCVQHIVETCESMCRELAVEAKMILETI